jgi:glycosyltransferase involved in cell wall biosynthesis
MNYVRPTPLLSVLIASRREMFLNLTIDSVLSNSSKETEVIVVLDGDWPIEPIPDNNRVVLIHHGPNSIGQRAAVNEAARLSRAKFIMKLDAHCKVDKDFDTKLASDIEYDWTVIPRMYNLHVFDWKCKDCGWSRYQSPTPECCEKCKSKNVYRDIKFQPRWNRRTDFARFDKTLHFQYWHSYDRRPEAQLDIADVMSSIGACWFQYRERFLELGGLDEAHGSWGQVGTEVACKTWLSGGRQVVNKKTWFSHLFRTQGGDFGFPYPMDGDQQKHAKEYSKWLWLENNWNGARYPFDFIIKKFNPPDWD